MQIDFETIEQHAGEKLRRIESQAGDAEERLVALRKFLKIEIMLLCIEGKHCYRMIQRCKTLSEIMNSNYFAIYKRVRKFFCDLQNVHFC